MFLSSVIRWIWIFFLPMMLCSCGGKCRSQSSGEVPLGWWERECSLQPLTSARKHSDTVMHPRIHAHTHFSAQVCWGNEVDSFADGQREWNVGDAEMFVVEESEGPQFIICLAGTKLTNLPAVTAVRRMSIFCCMRKETEKVS